MTKFCNSAIAVLALMVPMAAHADIGAIGSPVKISNPPKAIQGDDTDDDSTEDQAPATDQAAKPPLLTINFDQKYVNFDRELRQAVGTTEKGKAGVVYQVISRVPSPADDTLPSANKRLNDDSTANLNAVVSALRAQGVPESRISTSTESVPAGQAQEIDIYAQ